MNQQTRKRKCESVNETEILGSAVKQEEKSNYNKDKDHKDDLFLRLDNQISNNALAELHTHLMGMGDANFWVTKMIRCYIPRKEMNMKKEFTVFYPSEHLFKALDIFDKDSANEEYVTEKMFNRLESLILDNKPFSMIDIVSQGNYNGNTKVGIYNEDLLKLLNYEDDCQYKPLLGMIRNWFEFLDSSGNFPSNNDILQTYRGNFTPKFYPNRFIIKDCIIDKHPEVLGILLNTVLYRFGSSGVSYIEFSLSIKDIINIDTITAVTDKVFSQTYKKMFTKDVRNRNSNMYKTFRLHQNYDLEEVDSSFEEIAEDLNESSDITLSNDKSQILELKNSTVSNNTNQSRLMEIDGEHLIAQLANNESVNNTMMFSLTDTVQTYSYSSVLGNKDTGRIGKGLPKLTYGKTPNWRQFHRYYEKYTNQRWTFLAAFSRNLLNSFPCFNDNTKKINFEQLDTSNDVNMLLSKLANSITKTKEFVTDCYEALKVYASNICSDDSIEQMFGEGNKSFTDHKHFRNLKKLSNLISENSLKNADTLKLCVVGLDWVGDENGFPFCILSHNLVKKFVKNMKKINPKFGIRIHAGEGIMRGSSLPSNYFDVSNINQVSFMGYSFALHMYILMDSIRRVVWNMVCIKFEINDLDSQYSEERVDNYEKNFVIGDINVRIGHGVAFLYGFEKKMCTESQEKPIDPIDYQLRQDIAKFRKNILIKYQIVCELNCTSNHLLLLDSYAHSEKITNAQTLKFFLEAKIPVTLCTDDDGIWAIHKCQLHHSHISVASEYCNEIDQNNITTIEILNELVINGRKAAFLQGDIDLSPMKFT